MPWSIRIAAGNPASFQYLDDIAAAEREARLQRRREARERVDHPQHAELGERSDGERVLPTIRLRYVPPL